jgi:thymidylate synthase
MLTPNLKVNDIRNLFAEEFKANHFTEDKTGVKLLELVGFSFEADENTIFGKPNEDYIRRELDWYKSLSLNVNDIEAPIPKIWQDVSGANGEINSNYGWCVVSGINATYKGKHNHGQYWETYKELRDNPNSRRAIMIYTRPTIHLEYNLNGMSDFICTNTVQYVIRDETLIGIVQMRSNDAWAGFRNDFAWQDHVVKLLAAALGITKTKIIWHVGSIHLYESQFYLVDHYIKTGEIHVLKNDYQKL